MRLSYDLHKLTARLDRAADQVLQAAAGTTYPRFLALFAISEGARTQRELAAWLGVTEPSVSRMVSVLAADGLIEVGTTPGMGNRRHLALTATGSQVVGHCGRLLEQRFVGLVEACGVPYDDYAIYTGRLIDQLAREGIGPLAAPPSDG